MLMEPQLPFKILFMQDFIKLQYNIEMLFVLEFNCAAMVRALLYFFFDHTSPDI